jgi:hypothetical protein
MGETRADVHLVRSMMDLYDHDEDGLLDEVRTAHKPVGSPTSGSTRCAARHSARPSR